MLRSLLALLAALVPGLAVLFERLWLNVAAGLVIVGSAGLLGWWLWTTLRSKAPGPSRPSPDPKDSEPDLDGMGIVDIKPEDEAEDTETHPPAAAPSEDDAVDREQGAASSPASSPASGASAPPRAGSPEAGGMPPPASDTDEAGEDLVLTPLLESLRAAIDARTVCLLVQEDIALTYRIEAVASARSSVQSSGTFDTQTPLLTATMSRESVTLQPLADGNIAIEDLRYYDDPPAVDHLAAAPVSRPDASSTTFLLADAPAGTDLGASEARSVLKHYAETVALLLSTGPSSPSLPESKTLSEHVNGQHSEPDAPTGLSPSSAKDASSPRPRREIIADEMEAAQAADDDLALALVHLNRAESIAQRGDDAVASAERLFHARLEQLVPNQRIERFGELTYGIFFRARPDAVEPQVADVETTMAREDGTLEGGVSVGVAVWGGRIDHPKALRAEATKALREAYETGAPTIVT